ncbi:GNAT family N-acetyltransferase [Allorhizobium sp. BGMRC 0089]|uniref:GNAT family N-acetyltransferase n=1 Tax=Allorhizobium sonneratiae TaxID=2934936 RepID=UPI0020337EA9|nr:GNAT family N-acetyltransferase [Allorhizobium sonneratiae]MCM2292143.1 GNAT family N-acetyltransferase [Allorhizobium sonneratiae]
MDHSPSDVLTIERHDSMGPLESEWRQLEQDRLSSLHQSYDWCRAWVETHESSLAILIVRHRGRAVLLLPLEIRRRAFFKVAQFIGARFTNINTGLIDPDFRSQLTENTRLVLRHLIVGALKGHADLVHLGNVPFNWRGEPHPLSGMKGAVEHHNHSFQLPLLSDFAATLSQVNAKRRRKKFRNQHARLMATGGYEHISASHAEEGHDLLNLFFAQKAVRFEKLGLPDVFRDKATQAFFHRLIDLGPAGPDRPLQLHGLRLKGEHEGRIAAIAGLSIKGDHVICQFGSIDETLAADASPGELLFWLMIEKSCAEGRALFDFGLGDQLYKRSWCPVETVQHDLFLPMNGIGRCAALAFSASLQARAAIKRNPVLYRVLQRIRAWRTQDGQRNGSLPDGD